MKLDEIELYMSNIQVVYQQCVLCFRRCHLEGISETSKIFVNSFHRFAHKFH